MSDSFNLTCPLPFTDYPQVLLAHGGGGRLMQQLIEKLITPAFANPLLDQQHDGAVFEVGGQRVALTTDSYVVHPLFFPGGDIGALAVHGTVNDLAMCGARACWLTCALIIEEGLPMEKLRRVLDSMRQHAAAVGVEIVTGDTKVVDKGHGHGLFINTAGVGIVQARQSVEPRRVQPGDHVLLSGDLGRHGMAIMSVRESLQFETAIESDCASLMAPALALIEAGIGVHCLRDLTRGGLAAGLNEIAGTARLRIEIDEARVPVSEQVRGACEILGFDPLYVANEGRFIAFVPEPQVAAALASLRRHAVTAGAVDIGVVTSGEALVVVRSRIGALRVLDLLSGEQLPRIC